MESFHLFKELIFMSMLYIVKFVTGNTVKSVFYCLRVLHNPVKNLFTHDRAINS